MKIYTDIRGGAVPVYDPQRHARIFHINPEKGYYVRAGTRADAINFSVGYQKANSDIELLTIRNIRMRETYDGPPIVA